MENIRKISISAIQFKPPEKNPVLAIKRLLPMVEAASKISDLVVLPELACTNYLFDSKEEILLLKEYIYSGQVSLKKENITPFFALGRTTW